MEVRWPARQLRRPQHRRGRLPRPDQRERDLDDATGQAQRHAGAPGHGVGAERVVQRGLGRTNLMLFAEFDLGDILRRETGSETPKIKRLVVGNPLIMKEMVKHVADAGSYAPVTLLIDERPDGVHVSYDKMESYLLHYGSSEALTVARNLDAKITTLLRECAS